MRKGAWALGLVSRRTRNAPDRRGCGAEVGFGATQDMPKHIQGAPGPRSVSQTGEAVRYACVATLMALALPATGWAVSTRSFVLDAADEFNKGKLDGAVSWSTGKLTAGTRSERVAVEGVSVAYSSARGKDGAIYLGTGHDGLIMKVLGKSASRFADLDCTLVTSLVAVGDKLYAGVLPKGRVIEIDAQGKARDFAVLAGAQQVWALARDDKSGTLYAATGPEGKLFRIDAKGKAELLYDDPAEHLLSVVLDSEGRPLVGTSNGARLVRVSKGAPAQVLYDFPGQELTALASAAGRIIVAANDFSESSAPGGEGGGKDGSARVKRPKPGKGKVLVLEASGQVRELYDSDKGHVSALEIDAKGERVFAGLAVDGRVLALGLDGTSAAVADADERQVVALHLTESIPYFVTSDGVALYRPADKSADATWTSAVLDAKLPSRWGTLAYRGRGAIRFETRAGNTETVDDTWTPFAALERAPQLIKSPAGRFLQLRATLAKDAELYAVEAYYLPSNQTATLHGVQVKKSKGEGASKAEGKSGVLALTWTAQANDEDRLRYRLSYRAEAQSVLLPLTREQEVLENNEYSWDTKAIPDGFYRVKVEASDELANPAPFVTRVSALSAPILVDNHAPELRELGYKNGTLSGVAEDELGPIAGLELSVDADLYHPIYPEDQLLDTARERFAVKLEGLSKGPHVVAVRVTDAAGNAHVRALELESR